MSVRQGSGAELRELLTRAWWWRPPMDLVAVEDVVDVKVAANRERWLRRLVRAVTPLIVDRTGLEAQPVNIACGWPSQGARGRGCCTLGECFVQVHDDGTSEIFVTPRAADMDHIAGIVVHELLHAFLPAGVGHGKRFSQAAKSLGLEGPPTATTVGDQLAADLRPILRKLGAYPHRAVHLPVKVTEPRYATAKCGCGYYVTTSTKWMDLSPPYCPFCLTLMHDTRDGKIDPWLVMDEVEITAGYLIADDPTLTVRRKGSRVDATWTVTDAMPQIIDLASADRFIDQIPVDHVFDRIGDAAAKLAELREARTSGRIYTEFQRAGELAEYLADDEDDWSDDPEQTEPEGDETC